MRASPELEGQMRVNEMRIRRAVKTRLGKARYGIRKSRKSKLEDKRFSKQQKKAG
ncbi:hypothetical protein O9992_10485 [Vibrio lentus]|nr:hypothetical protein [Vibrio lentus]